MEAGCTGFDAVISRLFAFVGPYLPLDANYAVGNFIRDALAGGPMQIGGDGTPYRSYLYAAHMAIWLWTLLMRGESGTAYNVGSPHEISIADLARCVSKVAAPAAEIRIARRAVPGSTGIALRASNGARGRTRVAPVGPVGGRHPAHLGMAPAILKTYWCDNLRTAPTWRDLRLARHPRQAGIAFANSSKYDGAGMISEGNAAALGARFARRCCVFYLCALIGFWVFWVGQFYSKTHQRKQTFSRTYKMAFRPSVFK